MYYLDFAHNALALCKWDNNLNKNTARDLCQDCADSSSGYEEETSMHFS